MSTKGRGFWDLVTRWLGPVGWVGGGFLGLEAAGVFGDLVGRGSTRTEPKVSLKIDVGSG